MMVLSTPGPHLPARLRTSKDLLPATGRQACSHPVPEPGAAAEREAAASPPAPDEPARGCAQGWTGPRPRGGACDASLHFQRRKGGSRGQGSGRAAEGKLYTLSELWCTLKGKGFTNLVGQQSCGQSSSYSANRLLCRDVLAMLRLGYSNADVCRLMF